MFNLVVIVKIAAICVAVSNCYPDSYSELETAIQGEQTSTIYIVKFIKTDSEIVSIMILMSKQPLRP